MDLLQIKKSDRRHEGVGFVGRAESCRIFFLSPVFGLPYGVGGRIKKNGRGGATT